MKKSFDPTKPVKTRAGVPARVIATNAKGDQPIIALVEEQGEEIPRSFTTDGFFFPTRKESSTDLVNVPPPKKTIKVWVNIYDGGISPHQTQEIAELRATDRRLACKEITIEYTEGEGLS